jgi:hypothetical protein
MKKTTLEKIRAEILRLSKSRDPKVISFIRLMRERYPELRP